MALLMATCRIRVGAGSRHLEWILAAGGPVVFAFWHNRLAVCGHLIHRRFVRRGHSVAVLASLSRDGELAARVGRARGFRMIRGSSSRGGLGGLLRLYRAVARDGCSAATAPDGPRGPAQECQPGTVMLARLAGVPIVPLAYAASHSWRVRSWDRLIVPRPFARAVVTVGEPLAVPADLPDGELAGLSAQLKRRLDELVEQAEALV
jgi:lysophospholipid acyltransferase (LPLAT)-like uncharacterized protein